MNPPSRTATARQAIPIAVAVLVVGATQLGRSGYSVDEEFTVFAVRGISAHGLPLLPSNLLYDRGLAYSYASWLAHALTGAELPAYRAVGLICAVVALWQVFAFMRRMRDATAAVVACALIAVSVPFWAVATSGRFYAPFLALYVATMVAMPSSLVAAALLAFGCRLTHELAFTLAMIPAVCAVLEAPQRRRWLLSGVAVVAGLVAAQALLFSMHWLAPSSGETMVKRFFLWQVLNLFARPEGQQFALPLAVMLVGWLAAPRHAWTIGVSMLSLSAMVLAFSVAQATNAGLLSVDTVRSVLVDGSQYPLVMFWHLASHMPLTLLLAMVLLVLRMVGAGGEWTSRDRAMHGLWLGWVLWFGVIDSGITTNYLLLPVSFLLMTIAVDAHAILIAEGAPAKRYFSAPARPAYAAVIGLVLIVGIDQWRRTSLDQARPTIVADGLDAIRASLQPTDRVACTDELGCLMLVGRIDQWLSLDAYVRERFIVSKSGLSTGVYTGVPAVFHPADTLVPDSTGHAPGRVLIVDIFKEHPIGNSRTWLPRALAQDGLQVVTLVETPQLRIVELSAPEALAHLEGRPLLPWAVDVIPKRLVRALERQLVPRNVAELEFPHF